MMIALRNWFLLAASLSLATAANARVITRVEQGRLNSIEACSACHQVRPEQPPRPPIHDNNSDMDVQPPSFMDIASAHGTDVAYLRKHITDPEWPMREQMLDEEYLRDIVVYIQSLKREAHPARLK
jgi:mono/diheme cytochrome c family protein